MKSHTILLLAFAAIAATLLFTTNSNDTTMTEFVNFKLKFNKNYSPIEESYRLKIFSDNLIKINLHNADPTQTYQMGITPFADLSTEEFVGKLCFI